MPQSLVDRCHSVAAKARAVREWRVLTSEQQKALKKALVAEKKKQTKAAKASTKRKRKQKSDDEKTAELAAKQAKDRERKRDARLKEKREAESLDGMLSSSSVDRPAAASASTNTKGRKASEACSQAKQLVDKSSRRRVECTEKAALRYADATRHTDGADMGGAFSQQMVITVNITSGRSRRETAGGRMHPQGIVSYPRRAERTSCRPLRYERSSARGGAQGLGRRARAKTRRRRINRAQ